MSVRSQHPLVGRHAELATLSERLRRAATGSREAILFEGEAGIGKTRLIDEAIARAREQGFAVFCAAADESDRSRTYGPLIEAFGAPSDPGSGSTGTAAERRVAVIDELVSMVDSTAGGGPAALVLDDLHWADPETLRIVRALVRRTRTLPFVCVCATRPDPTNLELELLIETIDEASRGHIVLDALDDEAVATLIGQLLPGDPEPAFRDRVAAARGNPFFVMEVIAAGPDEMGAGQLAPDRRRTVLRRLAHLSDDAKSIVRVASLVGPSIDISDLEAAIGRSSIELVPALDEAMKGGVLEDRGDVLVFRHDLVREAVYDDMPEAVRRRAHRDVAHALIAAGAPARRVAPHLARSAKHGDTEAVSWLRRAAIEEARRAPSVAADMLLRARELLSPNDPARDRIEAECAQALAWAGRVAEASALAADVLSRLNDPALAADLRAALGESLFFRGRLVEAGEQFEQAARDAPLSRRPLLIAEAALSRGASGQLAASQALLDEVPEADTTIDPRARSLAQSVRVVLAGARADYAGLEAGREAVRIADDDPTAESHRYGARLFCGYALIETDRFDEAVAVLRRGIRLDEMNGVAWSLPCYHSALGAQFFLRGEWDDAVAELETAETLLDEMGSSILGPQVHGLLAYIAARRDDRERAERELAIGEAELADAGPQTGVEWLVHTRVLFAEDAGDTQGALAILHAAWGLADAMGFRLAFRYFGPSYIRLALAHEERDTARAAVASIASLSDAATTRSMAGTVLLCQGMASSEEATLIEAVEVLRGTGRPLDLAMACIEAGAALRSNELVQEAIAIYEGLGAHRDVRLASGVLGSDAAPGKRRRRTRPVSGWESLSPTERRVVALIVEGLSNPAIAERMFVSRRTVETHLYHVFRKLGVTSRLEVAVRASKELGS